MKKEMYDTIDGRVLRSFEVIKKVGQGAYGQVWKARNKKTGATCALKKIYEAFRCATDAQKAYREIRYLQKLDHPSIVRLLAIHRPSNSRDVYLQLQFMEADLCVALKNSVLKEIHKHYIFYQLANTLSYLHAADLVHRDIKPSNILVNETCEVKLCDFGLIRSLRRENQNDELVLTENIATRWYRAPEILLCSTNYGKAIDVWSMGCVLAEMVMQRPIFQGSSTISQLEKIFQVTGKPTAADLDYLKNKSSINVIENMDIKERKSIRELLNTNDKHIVDLLERIFQVDPRKRPTALQILNHPFVSKFRGKVQEKLPQGPISILYEIKQLAIEDYKKLIFGEVDEKDIKISQPIPNAEEMIYKTMPNDLGRKNVIANYPWGNLEKKSPLHSSNMGQKSFSPFAARQKRQDKVDEISQQKKKERHSPSFLQNRKKQGITPSKTPQKLAPTPPKCEPIPKSPSQNEGGPRLLKKWTFPMANRNSMSPQKKQAPPIIPSKMISKVNSANNLMKANPEKAPEGDSKLQTIHELKHSQQFFRDSETYQFKRHNTFDMSKSKEKKGPPKFLLQNEKRNKEITPNKQRNERPNLIPSKSPIKSQSPFSKGGTTLLQQSLNFRSSNLCPAGMPAAKVNFLPQGTTHSKLTK